MRKLVLALLVLLSGPPSPAAIEDFVRGCVPQVPLAELMVALRDNPEDGAALTQLFERLNSSLTQRLEAELHLGSDDSAALLQEMWLHIWSGTRTWKGDRTWSDNRVATWIFLGAKFIHLNERALRRPISVGEDLRGEDPRAHQVRRDSIARIPDRLHRYLLIRTWEGKTQPEMATELQVSERFVSQNLLDARRALETVLKGHEPIVAGPRHHRVRDRLQEILSEEMAERPIDMPANGLRLTLAQFDEITRRYSPVGKKIAYEMFVEGKNGSAIAQANDVPWGRVMNMAKCFTDAACTKFNPDGKRVPVQSIWIVDENGRPLSAHRSSESADPPRNAVEVEGADFWDAIKDWNLTYQRMMNLRFVDRLREKYIGRVLSHERTMVEDTLMRGVERVRNHTGRRVTVENLKIVGDTSMIVTDPVELPANQYLRLLEEGQDPSDRAKLDLAVRMSSLPVTTLSRIVLIDVLDRPIGTYRQSLWVTRSEPAKRVRRTEYDSALAKLTDEEKRLADLYFLHGWAHFTLQYYLRVPSSEVSRVMNKAVYGLRTRVGPTDLVATQVHVY